MQIFSRKNAHFRYFIYLLSFLHAITVLNLLQCFGKRIENLVHLLLAHIERIVDVFHYLFGFLLCFAFGGSSCLDGLLIFGYLAGKGFISHVLAVTFVLILEIDVIQAHQHFSVCVGNSHLELHRLVEVSGKRIVTRLGVLLEFVQDALTGNFIDCRTAFKSHFVQC